MSDEAIQYLQNNREKLLNQLNQFLSIPSISTETNNADSMYEAAKFVEDYLIEIGFNKTEIEETGGHPLVYGEYNDAGPDAPTVLFYGHYDVQPVDPLEEWDSEPFKPTIRDERIYARGASDDKGQVFMQLAVFESLMKTDGKIPLNVKVCIEGEEEIGSENLYRILREKKEQFKADFVVISDSGMIAMNQPTILYGLKGFTGIEIEVTGPSHDLHSGLYGGAIRNPAMALAHILSSLKDKNEVITVPGFYKDVEPLTEEERKLMASVEGEDYTKSCNIPETASEKGYTANEHTMARPTLEVNGMFSGYMGEGTKTIIPSSATAKITCRLVPGQDPEYIQNILEEYIQDICPTGVTVEVRKEKLSAKAYKVEPSHSLIKKAAESYTKAFEKETVYVRMGGSIPVVEWLDDLYQIPVVLLGFGTPDDRLHSPNESFPLSSFDKGMETLVHYWKSFK